MELTPDPVAGTWYGNTVGQVFKVWCVIIDPDVGIDKIIIEDQAKVKIMVEYKDWKKWDIKAEEDILGFDGAPAGGLFL